MKIKNERVTFEEWDLAFVRKFGPVQAADMVLTFKAFNPKLPFLYDTYQLRHFLGLTRKKMFAYLKYIDREYRTTNIRKKNGGGRTLHVPSRKLKQIQTIILHKILDHLPVSRYATAYKKGAVLADNATPHVGHRYLLKLDITDFFGSIRCDQVYRAAFNANYFPKQIGLMLTRFCCRQDVLPQGAPTSPALSNLVMKNFDNNMGAWCAKRGIAYTRYCDDMTFSSDKPLYHVYEKAKTMLEEMGFQLNEKKTHFVTNNNRQSVTGLTVNEKVSISRDYKRMLRQEVYYVLRFGSGSDIPWEFWRNRQRPHGHWHQRLQYLQHLQGRVSFVLQVEPENQWFQKAARSLDLYTAVARRMAQREG